MTPQGVLVVKLCSFFFFAKPRFIPTVNLLLARMAASVIFARAEMEMLEAITVVRIVRHYWISKVS